MYLMRRLGPLGLHTCVCMSHLYRCIIYLCYFFSSTHLQCGFVPLGIAAEKGHLHVIQKLLQGGTNVNHQNKVITVLKASCALLNRCSKPMSMYVPIMLNTASTCMVGLIALNSPYV